MDSAMQSATQAPKPEPSTLPTDLRLERAANGGWVLWDGNGDPRIVASMIGAYSDPDDLISALHKMLRPPVDAEPDVAPPTHPYPYPTSVGCD